MEMKTLPNFVNPSSFLLCSFLPNFVTARIEEEKKNLGRAHPQHLTAATAARCCVVLLVKITRRISND
jgi:hypothetical protein